MIYTSNIFIIIIVNIHSFTLKYRHVTETSFIKYKYILFNINTLLTANFNFKKTLL